MGFLVDPQGFLGNLLSEVTGIFIGIVVALLVVDRYTALHQENQWARVRNLTYRAIAAHLCDLAAEVFIYFPVHDNRPMRSISEGRDKPSPDAITGMAKLVSQLRQLPEAVNKNQSMSDLAVEFYEAIRWDLDQIRDVLTPRVVQSSNDQAVIDALVEFDNARRRLHNAVAVHTRIVTHGILPDVINLLEESQALYAGLCEYWK
jgi:hypothetical protein